MKSKKLYKKGGTSIDNLLIQENIQISIVEEGSNLFNEIKKN